jgi:hypothetical protein
LYPKIFLKYRWKILCDFLCIKTCFDLFLAILCRAKLGQRGFLSRLFHGSLIFGRFFYTFTRAFFSASLGNVLFLDEGSLWGLEAALIFFLPCHKQSGLIT